MSLADHFQMWKKLGESTARDALAIKRPGVSIPRYVGGDGRLDSIIMEVSEGMLLAKEGADGLLAIQSRVDKGLTHYNSIKNQSWFTTKPSWHCLYAFLTQFETLPTPLQSLRTYVEDNIGRWIGNGHEVEASKSLLSIL